MKKRNIKVLAMFMSFVMAFSNAAAIPVFAAPEADEFGIETNVDISEDDDFTDILEDRFQEEDETEYFESEGEFEEEESEIYEDDVTYIAENEWNDNKGDANVFDLGEMINGTIDTQDDVDYYKFVLDETGEVLLDFTSYMDSYTIALYMNSDRIWESEKQLEDGSDSRKDSYKFDLEVGTYYIRISGNDAIGNYKIVSDFNNSGANEIEANSSMEYANSITIGDTIRGMISMTDEYDYYKFEVSSYQLFRFEVKSYVSSFIFRIYDGNGNKVFDSGDIKVDSEKNYKKVSEELDLDSGTYYICFTNTGDTGAYTGTYEIETKGTAANYTETEHNDTRDQANDIALPTEIRGRIGFGDEWDYYRFSVTAGGNLNVDVKSYLEKYIVRVYDSNGKLVFDEELDRKSGEKYRYDGFNVKLENSGTYYLCFTNRESCKGDYTIALSMDEEKVAKPTGTEFKKEESGKTVLYVDGEALTEYTGFIYVDDKWYYVQNGVLAEDKRGFVDYEGEKFLVVDGMLDTTANGLVQDPENTYDWYFCASGQVQSQYTGLAEYDGEWFYVRDGKLASDLSGWIEYDGHEFNVKNGKVDSSAYIYTDYDTYSVEVGDKTTVKLIVDSFFADTSTIKWVSADPTIATISADTENNLQGIINGVAPGKTTITVSAGDAKTTFNVTVWEIYVESIALDRELLNIYPGATGKLSISITPENTSPTTFTWESSNNQVATVKPSDDEKSAIVTGVKEGSATITVTSKNGHTASCVVKVENDEPVIKNVTGVTLDKTSMTMDIDETQILTATVKPTDATNTAVIWSTSDKTVATVDSKGIVTAVGAGTVTITAKTEDGGFPASCKVIVTEPLTEPVYVTGVSLNETKLQLTVGDSETLEATVDPSDASDKTVNWSSDNEEVATVDEKGKITAVTAGTATITVTTEDGDFSASCKVTVLAKSEPTTTPTPTPEPIGTGMNKDESGKTVYYKDGEAQTKYTGLVNVDDSWYYVQKGVVVENKRGYVDYEGGKFLVVDGVLENTANGLVQDPDHPDDWYFLSSGQAQTQYTGLALYDGEWFYVDKGRLDTKIAAYIEYDGGVFYVGAGRILSEVNGLAQDPNGGDWYYLANGQVQNQYTGLAQYDGAWFYVEQGRLAQEYLTMVEYDGAMFCSEYGMIVDVDKLSSTDVIIAWANNVRKIHGIDLLHKNDTLSTPAQIRASEVADDYSDIRPNGKEWWTVLKEYGISAVVAQCKAKSDGNPEMVVQSWVDENSKEIFNQKYQNVGAGMIKKESDIYAYWVLLLME